MSRTKKTLTMIAALAVVALVVESAMAQPPGGPRGQRGFARGQRGPAQQGQRGPMQQGQRFARRGPQDRGDQLARIAERLELTDEQREQLKQIRLETREKIQAAVERIRDEAKEKMRGVLNAEQQEQWEQMRLRMAEAREQRRAGRPGGPPVAEDDPAEPEPTSE